MTLPEFLLLLLRIWGSIGTVVVLIFLAWGIDRIDEDAQGAYVFRLLLIPGILLLWPLVLWRWWQIETERVAWFDRYRPSRRHGPAILAMSAAIVALVVFGLNARQYWPKDIVPMQLSERQ